MEEKTELFFSKATLLRKMVSSLGIVVVCLAIIYFIIPTLLNKPSLELALIVLGFTVGALGFIQNLITGMRQYALNLPCLVVTRKYLIDSLGMRIPWAAIDLENSNFGDTAIHLPIKNKEALLDGKSLFERVVLSLTLYMYRNSIVIPCQGILSSPEEIKSIIQKVTSSTYTK